MFADVNWLAVLVCTIASVFLGFIWYTPILFGKIWMKELGFKEEDFDPKDGMKAHIYSIVTTFISTVILAVFLSKMGITGAVNGILVGLGVGFCFIGLAFFGNDRYEKKSFTLSLINTGYRTVYFVLASLILTVWK